jgi:hypothetical protein
MKKTNKNKLCKDSGRCLYNTPAAVQLSMSNANKLDGRHGNRPPPVKARILVSNASRRKRVAS